MSKGSKIRFANGVVSAAIVVFFLVHATLGSVSALTGFRSPFAWFVWVGVALVAAHVVISVFTSREQLTDVERPPSARKKRHLALKWATGGLLLAAAAVHVVVMRTWGAAAAQSTATGAVLTIVLATVLAIHLCVGSKSVLKDLGIDRRYMTPFRVVVCAFAVLFAVSAIAAVVL